MSDMSEVYDALRKANAAGDTQSVAALIEYINSQGSTAYDILGDAAPRRSMPDELMRQTGLATRPMVQSAMTVGGLAPMVVDPLVNLFNLATGTKLPTMTQATQTNLNRMGFPQPEKKGWCRTLQVLAMALLELPGLLGQLHLGCREC